MPKRAEQALAVLITVLAAVLHLLRARHAGALWRDEAGAAQLAAFPSLREVFENFPHEAFPLLFPVTLRTYMGVFGDSDLAFRLFGLAVGLAILAALWRNARAAGALPLASLALVQLHPAFPLYGDSIRGYGLGTLAILLTFGAFARLVARPDGRTAALTLLGALASVHLLLHNAALLAGLGAAAMAVGVLRRRFRVTLLAGGIGLVAALTLLPYLGPLREAKEWRIVLIQEVAPREILGKLAEVTGNPFPWLSWVWVAVAAVAAWVALHRLTRPASEETATEHDVRLFRLLVVPAALGGEIAFLLALGYPPRMWYLLPVLALVASALDGLIAGGPAPARWLRAAAAILLVVTLWPAALGAAMLRMTNVDHVARALEQDAGPRDLILVNEWYYGVSFHRYYHGRAQGRARWMTVPALADHRVHRFDLLKEKMMAEDPLRDVRRAVRRTLRRGGRVWVVGRLEPPPAGGPLALPPAPNPRWGWLDAPYVVSWSQQLSALLEEQSTRKRTIRIPAGGRVNGMEALGVWRFGGWRAAGSELGGLASSPPGAGLSRPNPPTARPGSPGRPSPGGRDTPRRTAGGPGRRGG